MGCEDTTCESFEATDLALFITGLLLSATAETPFDTFVKLWPGTVSREWTEAAHRRGWAFQSFTWGDPNSDC